MERDNKLAVTVLIAVKNEAVNLPRCLANLRRAEKIKNSNRNQCYGKSVQFSLHSQP